MDSMKGDALTYAAFCKIPYVGPIVLTVGMLTFVFSTILGWSYYGERATEYLFGKKSILPYRLAWVAAVFIGSIASLDFVWDFADAMNALMALPNVIALLLLSGVIVSETRKYLWENRLDQQSADDTHSTSTSP
jgi:alanine or glycine:cation symporter, AGCS family